MLSLLLLIACVFGYSDIQNCQLLPVENDTPEYFECPQHTSVMSVAEAGIDVQCSGITNCDVYACCVPASPVSESAGLAETWCFLWYFGAPFGLNGGATCQAAGLNKYTSTEAMKKCEMNVAANDDGTCFEQCCYKGQTPCDQTTPAPGTTTLEPQPTCPPYTGDSTCQQWADNNGVCEEGFRIRQGDLSQIECYQEPFAICCQPYVAMPDCHLNCCEPEGCHDPCDPMTCESNCQSKTGGVDTCPDWKTDKKDPKTRPNVCDLGSNIWDDQPYPFEHNCGCKINHENGCDQCRDGFFQMDLKTPCLCCEVLTSCHHCQSFKGCAVCKLRKTDDGTSYYRPTPSTCQLYPGSDRTIDVCGPCSLWYARYETFCPNGVDGATCAEYNNTWPVDQTHRKKKEFEDCSDSSIPCEDGLKCHKVNVWYSQCRSENRDCTYEMQRIFPDGLSDFDRPLDGVNLTVWYTRAGQCTSVSCSQAGPEYYGDINFCCGEDSVTSFVEWDSSGNNAGDCFMKQNCVPENKTITYSSDGSQHDISLWYTVEARDQIEGTIQLPCATGYEGEIIFKCTKSKFVKEKETCTPNCYAGGECTEQADCCGNLVCTNFTEVALCVAPENKCTLDLSKSTTANLDATTSESNCAGSIGSSQCTLSCAAGHTLHGCAECWEEGGIFDLDAVICHPDNQRPTCECSRYQGGDNERDVFQCQGRRHRKNTQTHKHTAGYFDNSTSPGVWVPAKDEVVRDTVGDSNIYLNDQVPDFEPRVCYNRPGQTGASDRNNEPTNNRCGEGSALEMHYGPQGNCQLTWECELAASCGTDSGFWTDAKCQELGGDNSWVAKNGLNNKGCGASTSDCTKELCCQQPTCDSFFASGECENGLSPRGGDYKCGDNCDETTCCAQTCDAWNTDGQTCAGGLTYDARRKDVACGIKGTGGSGASWSGECGSTCCHATCQSVHDNDANWCSSFEFTVNITAGLTLNAAVADQECGNAAEDCDKLFCCEHVTCKEVLDNDSSFCSAAGLSPVAFTFQPCGKDIASCGTDICCRATCADFCSAGQASRVGDGEPTSNCYWPDEDTDIYFNSTYKGARVTNLNCRNAGDECGPTTELCAKSLCCEIYGPEYPSNPMDSNNDHTYKGHAGSPQNEPPISVSGQN